LEQYSTVLSKMMLGRRDEDCPYPNIWIPNPKSNQPHNQCAEFENHAQFTFVSQTPNTHCHETHNQLQQPSIEGFHLLPVVRDLHSLRTWTGNSTYEREC
jgi:hypothetical protein